MRKLLWSAALVMCVATQACSNETAVLSVETPQPFNCPTSKSRNPIAGGCDAACVSLPQQRKR